MDDNDDEKLGTAPVSTRNQVRVPDEVLERLDLDPQDNMNNQVGFVENGNGEIEMRKAEMSF